MTTECERETVKPTGPICGHIHKAPIVPVLDAGQDQENGDGGRQVAGGQKEYCPFRQRQYKSISGHVVCEQKETAGGYRPPAVTVTPPYLSGSLTFRGCVQALPNQIRRSIQYNGKFFADQFLRQLQVFGVQLARPFFFAGPAPAA